MRKVSMNPDGQEKILSASDVEKYGYCPLSWWLSEQNAIENEEELRKGSKDHALIGKDVKKIKFKEKASRESERSILWFSLISIVIGINGIAIIYPIYTPSSQGKAVMVLLSIIAVLWVIVAVFFFYSGIKSEMRIRRQQGAAAKIKMILSTPNMEGDIHRDVDWRRRFTEAKWWTLLFFIVSGVLALHGFIILLTMGQVQSQIYSRIFLILSLFWLIGSSFFYYISLSRDIRVKETKETKEKGFTKRAFTDSEVSVVLFAVIATIFASNSLTTYQNPHSYIGRILLIVAILWLYGGFVFLYRALRANFRLRIFIEKQLREAEILEGGQEITTQADLKYRIEKGSLDYERGVIWFAAIAIILALNAIIMNFSESLEELYGTLIAHIFEVVALVWLLGASFFLYMVLRYSRMLARLKVLHGIGEGSVDYVDTLDEEEKVMYSKKYGLRGRPDYIIKNEGDLVPVEVKTGRTPRGPLFSHILQIAAYCLLIEENHDRRPPYGIIRYSDVQHKIEYTDELKDTLITKLNEMRKIMKNREVHRNHNRPSKCKGCSRRKMCPEKLV